LLPKLKESTDHKVNKLSNSIDLFNKEEAHSPAF